MRSLRTKITFMTLCVLVITVVVLTVLSVFFIRKSEQRKADQVILLLCDTGAENLEYYFTSVQKSVEKVAKFVEADIDGIDDDSFSSHMERVGEYFEQMAYRTNGVLTYYYRVDPSVSDNVPGFWYTNLDGEGFIEHEVANIRLYDTEDTSQLVWFTVPKFEDKAVCLPPYITDNLDVRVISYNVPVHWRGQFIGVVGIEIDYSTMAEQVDSIHLYDKGYAFLNSSEGSLFYHPKIDISSLPQDKLPDTPDGVLSSNTFIRYKFNGEERVGAWLPLSNGMRLNVTVPLSETEGDWRGLILNITIVAGLVLAAASLFSMIYTKKIVKPLKQLTEAAEQTDRGNYDYPLEYTSDDELGRLTSTFKRLSAHMKDHINNLNQQVFVDSLTNVKNKGAFSDYLAKLQKKIADDPANTEFAIGVFDCDDLKLINDKYGHENGDVYLKAASCAICGVFQHSPVFRIGGDEFSVILVNEDYYNREVLTRKLDKVMDDVNRSSKNEWDQVHISKGIAEYSPESDTDVSDVVRRADKLMYENKRFRKKGRRN